MNAPLDPPPTSTAAAVRAARRLQVEGEQGPTRTREARWTASVSLTRWTRNGESRHRQHRHAQARLTSDVNAHRAGTWATRSLCWRRAGTAGRTRPSSAVMEAKVAQIPKSAVDFTSCIGCLSRLFLQKVISFLLFFKIKSVFERSCRPGTFTRAESSWSIAKPLKYTSTVVKYNCKITHSGAEIAHSRRLLSRCRSI